MKEREGRFSGAKGMSIYYHYWEPEQPPRGLVLVIHGAGEHCMRYQHLGEQLTARGLALAGLDHIGHGKSDGTYGHVDRFADFAETLEIYQRQVQGDFPGVPMILLGHSMGGLISANYLLKHQQEFIGCVLSGPAIKTELQPGAVQIALIRFLSAIAPRMGALQLDASGVSRDPAEVEKYQKDPLVNHGKMSARKVSELFKWMGNIQEHAREITLPLLLLHGGEDLMTSPAGSQFLYDEVASQDKTLKIYPGLYHEIFNEPEKEEVLADLLNWCEQRLTASA